MGFEGHWVLHAGIIRCIAIKMLYIIWRRVYSHYSQLPDTCPCIGALHSRNTKKRPVEDVYQDLNVPYRVLHGAQTKTFYSSLINQREKVIHFEAEVSQKTLFSIGVSYKLG